MKKIIAIFVCVMIIIFLMMSYMVYVDKRNTSKVENMIMKKTNIKDIDYFNKYDNYYIVLANDYLYLYDKDFKELLKIDKTLICENSNNYDIIYKDKHLMYFNDYYKKKELVYEYYDLYTCELIDKALLG